MLALVDARVRVGDKLRDVLVFRSAREVWRVANLAASETALDRWVVSQRPGSISRAPDAGAMLSSTAPAGGARKNGGKNNGGGATAAAEVDWSLPPIWIDRKARLQHNRYVEMLRTRDARDLAEDARKKAEAKTAALSQRDALDAQVAYQAKLRRQNQEEIAKDRVAIEADLMAFERETAAKAARQAAVIAKEKVQRGAQVEANRERVARAAAQAMAEDKAGLVVGLQYSPHSLVFFSLDGLSLNSSVLPLTTTNV